MSDPYGMPETVFSFVGAGPRPARELPQQRPFSPTDKTRTDTAIGRGQSSFSSGIYSMISSTEQFNILQIASIVFVDMESPALMRRIEELLTLPFTCKV